MHVIKSSPLVVLFAVDHEAAPFRATLRQRETFFLRSLQVTTGLLERHHILTACVGMGPVAVDAALDEILDFAEPDAVMMAGYGGALDPQLKKGDVIVTKSVALDGIRLKAGSMAYVGEVVSLPGIAATPIHKKQLYEESAAHACDMETSAVRERLAGTVIEVIGVRAISDTANESLPEAALNAAYDMERQRPTPARLVGHLLMNPNEIRPFATFVAGLSLPRENLKTTLIEIIRQHAL